MKYPTWLANLVLVRKAASKWRMCMYFTNLNTASPKDPYLLLEIDRLIDGSSVYCTLSFMDAYLGYNQIQIDHLDDPKADFMSNNGYYYDNVMPFGLKNVGATYHRLMDVVLSH